MMHQAIKFTFNECLHLIVWVKEKRREYGISGIE